jgi:hypothetical protein
VFRAGGDAKRQWNLRDVLTGSVRLAVGETFAGLGQVAYARFSPLEAKLAEDSVSTLSWKN